MTTNVKRMEDPIERTINLSTRYHTQILRGFCTDWRFLNCLTWLFVDR